MSDAVERTMAKPAVASGPARKRERTRLIAPVLGALLLLLFLACALFPGRIAPYDPNHLDYLALLKPPSLAHPFGTDNLGRDMLSRVIFAASIDLQIAIFCTVLPLLFGTMIGALIGYRGGLLDALFGRLVDLSVTVPFLILVIAIVAVLGPGLFNLYVAVSLVGWVPYARLTRSEMMVQSKRDYAAAARAMGFGTWRIVFRHLLPNAITPTIVYWMTDLSLAVLLGSSLGYLGLGAQPPTAEWGVLIADGKNFMTTAWWMSIFPGAAIVMAGLSFSLLGDTLADWLRPK
ncbi:peptide/nickel transport system permease protein [Rhizobiales bacterium GAS113]|jgi:peptide/nickel transport system permease protein|nr:peptide/nickel transport system permease protein [Rhizobiales bacterium GAS113]SEB89889.1 peptide/nickel transport system permease protein [Rhizobiales bacterium GAS188]